MCIGIPRKLESVDRHVGQSAEGLVIDLTDRCFGVGGPAARMLAALDPRVIGDADLALAMCALDPCLPWSVGGRRHA